MPKKEDSESESLLLDGGGSHAYTEEDGGGGGGVGEMDYVDTDVSVLSQFHEDALQQAGFGLFQYFLFMILGLGLAADSIEVFVIAYILPSAERELCMDSYRKGWLAAVSFLGMMIGGLVWGTLGDRVGRRRTLVSALATNAVFAIATAFMPTYGLFLITRFCSGIGVGGSLPIVFTYYGEFLVKRNRGRHLSWLLIFWGIGGLYTAVIAWLMITEPEEGNQLLGSRLSSWRIFLVVCATPALITVFGLFFLPESPRYLLECGRDVEAMYVYQKVFRINHKQTDEYQLSEMELPSRRSPNSVLSGGCLSDFLEAFDTFWGSFMQILWPPYTKVTLVLLMVWITTAFGFYGMSIWFPEYVRQLREEEFERNATLSANGTLRRRIFSGVLANERFENVRFDGGSFHDIVLDHVEFVDCVFLDVHFENVHASRTFFHQSTFRRVIFDHTDLYDYRFIGCKFYNSYFNHTHEGCGVDFLLDHHLSDVFKENLYTQFAIIPGNIFSSLILDRIGRVKTMASSLFVTSASALVIWFLDTRNSVIAFEAIFNFISISGWNAVDVITTESYPASLRATGYGFLSAMSRISAILGNLTFAAFIHTSKALPVLTTAAVLFVGALCSLKLHETKDTLM
ncbi:hypothetical protein JTE90_025780 [Oedothorax gibbosus]|uniref:Major facilitator superfamily (MFS) profile domain-containing protein n=1 Tax=Oedothorax gibbosus TaxID=931172 RepID=A0AAV6V326_9ARAC|nr:hypothetical protein JTE90_025780 [Oedothorax gibbosus]